VIVRDHSVIARRTILCLMLLAVVTGARAQDPVPGADVFFAAAGVDAGQAESARKTLAASWNDGYAAMLIELLDVLRRTGFVDPRGFVQLVRLSQFLEQQTGQTFGADIDAWHRWIWSRDYVTPDAYPEFKGRLYARLDPRFADFFVSPLATSIRLDEIQWGGVAVNGIPPLVHPATLTAQAATYLDDGDIVFGLVVDGEARAYPKRILAWHELALDRVGNEELTIVYCTLCGTVIPFESAAGGKDRVFGTSGFLYQSNKLMFDEGTHSLWSSLTGRPVVGPLVGSGLELQARPVVTTTWGEWRRRHPATTVLSLATGFDRDYSEGAAYRSYFGTDALMFDVSRHDGRLPNKAEVLVLRAAGAEGQSAGGAPPVAIAADYLTAHPVYALQARGKSLVVLTDSTGANRVYETGSVRFDALADRDRVRDASGRLWRIDEDALHAEFDEALSLPRVAAHRAFWFGWYAQHPDTQLID
jgi:hypothetical protein